VLIEKTERRIDGFDGIWKREGFCREGQHHGGNPRLLGRADERQRVRRGVGGSVQPEAIRHALVRLG
jgi:hypothetical protein